MKHIIHAATKIKYKTDGLKVWWWSSSRGVWNLDTDCTPQVIESMLQTGNAYPTLPQSTQ